MEVAQENFPSSAGPKNQSEASACQHRVRLLTPVRGMALENRRCEYLVEGPRACQQEAAEGEPTWKAQELPSS